MQQPPVRFSSEPILKKLDVPRMLAPILQNYDAQVSNFISFLRARVDCTLIYDGPTDIHEHICERMVYACSVQHRPTGKVLRNVFPVMLGSKLDLAIRHLALRQFCLDIPTAMQSPFEEPDIGRGFFIINGSLRHLPYFFTNDPTKTHLSQKKTVRVFTYDTHDRGKELSYYIADCPPKRRGDMMVVCNDGSESLEQVDTFFDHCPYPTDPTAYMAHVYQNDQFDIDSLANKIVVSPGHLFTKLFVKYLYAPLREGNWNLVKSKTTLVVKSIQSGCLLHVLSRKTVYFKEGKSAGKMTNTPHESHREIGANGEVFIEKSTGCYREVNSQTYPLNPYLSHVIVRQISSKVKSNSIPPFHDSYVGFLCILGCFETKNVGRTMMMCRNTATSTCNELDPVFHHAKESDMWTFLRLEPDTRKQRPYYVVVNEACIPVTQACFRRIDLLQVKRRFRHVECTSSANFIFVQYKMGLLFKPLPGTDIWVTPGDALYWSRRLLHLHSMDAVVERFGFDFITSFHVDINPFFMHTAFPKNTLGFNALKNAVLAIGSRYAEYFMDSLSAYVPRATAYHKNVLEPEDDGVSPHFVLKVPHLVVMYASFLGCTQEDSIVLRRDVTAFDCYRFYTIRVKLEADGLVLFHPVRGDSDETSLLGTIVHYGESPLKVEPFSIHVRTVSQTNQVVRLHFSKPPFRVIRYHLTATTLSICMEQEHLTNTGDKLCSFHGQKGVMRVMERVPLLDESVRPDILVNPYGLFRVTPGQILEGVRLGGGRDARTVHNSDGQWVRNAKAFYAKTFYFPIAYWSSEHLYAPRECTMDKILQQAVKGRSRGGGMRLGNMELLNGLRGNGLAACFEEKFCEHGDRVALSSDPTIAIPKSVELVQEDARFFKCNLGYKTIQSVTERTVSPEEKVKVGASTSTES
ncbi:hypothetical protein AVEN_261790-1 [Araneus ventricosus]|uniref:DNA-directed RNA polymerase n=1 Tax=Araneus ventricosus TaxID=182803 RepID=A0A4Y2M1Y7_ARAVE|nr:hypothetical protein AVEN_261790-1 [Araneus ventricosus]